MSAITGESVVSVDPEVMSGAPVFRGTRVPIVILFDYLAAGDPLEEFFEDFPGVTHEQVTALLSEASVVLEKLHRPSAA